MLRGLGPVLMTQWRTELVQRVMDTVELLFEYQNERHLLTDSSCLNSKDKEV